MPEERHGPMNLEVEIAGIKLRNPLILASGVLGETADLLMAAYRAGAGAVVTKSIGLEPKEGHHNPTVFEFEFGLINAMGLPNPGMDEFQGEMERLRGEEVVVVASIFGSDSRQLALLAERMEGCGARAIELNLSCPHAKGYGSEVGSSPEVVQEMTAAAVDSVDIPVFSKLTPNTSDIVSLGRAAQEGGAAAVVAINTVKAMAIDPYLGRPALANRIGGLSGPAIKPIGLRCVFELHRELSIPIIGVGGVRSGTDVVEYLLAGASAVQIGTAVKDEGLETFAIIRRELELFMSQEGIRALSALRGVAHRE